MHGVLVHVGWRGKPMERGARSSWLNLPFSVWWTQSTVSAYTYHDVSCSSLELEKLSSATQTPGEQKPGVP